MDDGEVESTLDNAEFPESNSSGKFQTQSSIDTFRTCLHTHTCNVPGLDAAAHTHTCYHTHTQVLMAEENDGDHSKEDLELKPKRRRPSGNREAVRKYREKKKAHTAYLEEEVKKLQLLNQQIVRKLKGSASLEVELSRLRNLLLEFRGKIDNEFRASPLEKQNYEPGVIFKEGSDVGENDLHCQNDLPCFFPFGVGFPLQCGNGSDEKAMVTFGGNCQFPVNDCQDHPNRVASAEVQNPQIQKTLVSSATQDK